MIGQKFSLRYLMPIALKLLEDDPLAEGDLFPGDLLCNVLKAGSEYYDANPKVLAKANDLLERALTMVEHDKIVENSLLEAHAVFMGNK